MRPLYVVMIISKLLNNILPLFPMRILDEDPEHKYDHKNVVPTEKEKKSNWIQKRSKGIFVQIFVHQIGFVKAIQ